MLTAADTEIALQRGSNFWSKAMFGPTDPEPACSWQTRFRWGIRGWSWHGWQCPHVPTLSRPFDRSSVAPGCSCNTFTRCVPCCWSRPEWDTVTSQWRCLRMFPSVVFAYWVSYCSIAYMICICDLYLLSQLRLLTWWSHSMPWVQLIWKSMPHCALHCATWTALSCATLLPNVCTISRPVVLCENILGNQNANRNNSKSAAWPWPCEW